MVLTAFVFAAFAVLGIVGPGVALQRRLALPVDLALVLPLGFVFVAATYGLGARLEAPWLFPIVALALDLSLLTSRAAWPVAPGPSLRGAMAPVLAIVALFALTEYRQNRVTADGTFAVDRVDPEDQVFHVGLAYELTHSYPPQVPGLAGYNLSYHLGWPLVRAAATRWAGVSPYDGMSRFDLTLGALALILALRAAAAAMGGSSAAVALVAWTVPACGLSFALARSDTEWWFTLFPGDLLPHLFHSNSVVPALAIALGALVAFERSLKTRRVAGFVLAAVLAAAVPSFKIFLAAHLAFAIAVAALLRRSVRLAVAVGLPLVLSTALLAHDRSGARMDATFDVLGPVWHTRAQLGLAPAVGASALAWAAAWLVLALGPRLIGLGEIVSALRRGSTISTALSVVAASGWPLSLLLRLATAEPYSRHTQANDALYFMDQSGPLLWLFTALAVGGALARDRRRGALLLAPVVLGFVSTFQFVWHKATMEPARMPAGIVRAMAELRRHAQPGQVILQEPEPKRYPPPPLVLAPLRIPYTRSIPYLTQFAPRADLDQRLALVRRFFSTTSTAEAAEIARMLGARFFFLYGSERTAFDPAGTFRVIYEEPNVRLYEMAP